MTQIPTPADERRLIRLIGDANVSGEPIAPRSKDGRYIRSMDQGVVRDLRGVQFEREVREAFDRATSTRSAGHGCGPDRRGRGRCDGDAPCT